MEKKLITFLAVLLFAGVSANAQIGVSRDGKLLMPYYDNIFSNPFDINKIYSYDSWDMILPKYLPKTRAIKMTRKYLKYNEFTEDWEYDSDESEYKIVFDTAGRIIESFVYIWNFEEEKGHNVFTYENNRIVRITNIERGMTEDNFYEKDVFAFKYDNSGNLFRILQNGETMYEYRVFWYSQNYISNIKSYKEGNEYESENYKITKNGNTLVIKKANGSPNYIYVDTHGIRTREDWQYHKYFYKNTYDENGNLIKHLMYQNKDTGKHYENGCLYEYEYEFYD